MIRRPAKRAAAVWPPEESLPTGNQAKREFVPVCAKLGVQFPAACCSSLQHVGRRKWLMCSLVQLNAAPCNMYGMD